MDYENHWKQSQAFLKSKGFTKADLKWYHDTGFKIGIMKTGLKKDKATQAAQNKARQILHLLTFKTPIIYKIDLFINNLTYIISKCLIF